MKQVKKITPSTVVEVNMEVRFNSTYNGSTLTLRLGKKLDELFPKIDELPSSNIPSIIREQEEAFRIQPTHVLMGEDFSVRVGSSAVTVNFSRTDEKDYQGWENYYSVIKKVINALFEVTGITNVSRIGVRYINSFKNEDLPQLLDVNLKHPFKDDEVKLETGSSIGFIVKKNEDLNCKLQIISGAQLNKPKSSTKVVIIDVDSSKVTPTPKSEVLSTIAQCHDLSKYSYFSVLNEKYINENFKITK